MRHATQHLANGAVVTAQGPAAAGVAAGENHVHGTSRADGPLELALSASHVAAVLRSGELDLRGAIEDRELHIQRNVSIVRPAGNVVSRKSNGKSTSNLAHSVCHRTAHTGRRRCLSRRVTSMSE